jgi:hypothetical protein
VPRQAQIREEVARRRVDFPFSALLSAECLELGE